MGSCQTCMWLEFIGTYYYFYSPCYREASFCVAQLPFSTLNTWQVKTTALRHHNGNLLKKGSRFISPAVFFLHEDCSPVLMPIFSNGNAPADSKGCFRLERADGTTIQSRQKWTRDEKTEFCMEKTFLDNVNSEYFKHSWCFRYDLVAWGCVSTGVFLSYLILEAVSK